jgi:predicted permease
MKRRGVRSWFRLPVTDRVLTEADVDAELASHIEERVERLVARGMPESEARAEAERRLGGLVHARSALVREAWDRDVRLSLMERLGAWVEDARYAARSVFRERGYATVVIVTLALGIGANATMFGVLDRLLLSGPAHVEAPDELYRFYTNSRNPVTGDVSTWQALNGPALMAFREGVASLEHISGYMSQTLTLGAGAEARQLDVGAVSASFFELVGVRPVLGRFFDESEDGTGAGEPVIVLGHGVWQRDFGGRTDILGGSLELSGRSYTIIGVAPPGFTGVQLEPRDGWIPLALRVSQSYGPGWAAEWTGFYMPIVGRLREGASPERAVAEATAAWAASAGSSRMGESHAANWITLAGIRADASGAEPLEARVARWLIAVSAIVLLVACANVANLYFARGLKRRREVAVRLALGISRGRLIRLLLVEAMLLAVLGGVAALAVAYWGAELVRGVLLPQVDWTTSPLNARVLAVAAALTALVGVVTGLAPALQATNTRLAPSLTGSVHAPPAPGRGRNVLAVLQAAFCVLLLVGAGLFVRSLWTLQRLDIGLDAERVLTVRVAWQTPPDLTPEQRAELEARRRTFFTEAVERMAALPGIEHASAGIGVPFLSAQGGDVRAQGVDSVPQQPGGGPYVSAVTADHFTTLGTQLLRGRYFGPGEGGGTEPVAILSRSLADALWPGADPLERCLHIGGSPDAPCSRVVGVVADVRRFRIQDEAEAGHFYVPLGQASITGNVVLLARTSMPPERMVEPLRAALYDMEPTLRYANVVPYADILQPQRRPWTLGASLFVICGVLALLIAVIGLYSVIAYLVLHRRHEIGVRMALGAERGDIVGMVLRQALILAGIGVAIGSVVAFLAAPALQPLLFETAARDYAIFAGVALTLGIAALLAGTVPALRASRVAPTQALRDS